MWAEPNLFKLDKNAGAPGDPEQNWGFPPYNWGEMHKDGCSWWRRRLQHMEQYFHAYRIDHILGFFRMWEIPKHGSGGRYEPSSGLRENGLKNLRAIQTASNMLICGEDLGQVPPEVGPVLLELGILGLKIQRWCDGKTWEYPLLTVAASSCHDTSPCRLWWNENWGEAERFFQSFCGQGNCPGGPPDWVSKKIIKMHAESSGMWTINPIQDYLDMEEGMRSKNAKADMINVPGSTDGYTPLPLLSLLDHTARCSYTAAQVLGVPLPPSHGRSSQGGLVQQHAEGDFAEGETRHYLLKVASSRAVPCWLVFTSTTGLAKTEHLLAAKRDLPGPKESSSDFLWHRINSSQTDGC